MAPSKKRNSKVTATSTTSTNSRRGRSGSVTSDGAPTNTSSLSDDQQFDHIFQASPVDAETSRQFGPGAASPPSTMHGGATGSSTIDGFPSGNPSIASSNPPFLSSAGITGQNGDDPSSGDDDASQNNDAISSETDTNETDTSSQLDAASERSSVRQINNDLSRQEQLDTLSVASSHPYATAAANTTTTTIPQQTAAEAQNAEAQNNTSSSSSSDRVRVIWGTNIVVSDAISVFKEFLTKFTLAHRKISDQRASIAASIKNSETPSDTASSRTTSSDLEAFYPKLLAQIRDTEIYNINIDCANLRAFPSTVLFAQQLLHYPNEIVSLMDMVVNELFAELFPDNAHLIANDPIQVRPFGIGNNVNMRCLDPSDIDKLVSIKGLIIRVSNVIPDMRVGYFVCSSCGSSQTVENIRGRIAEPSKCLREGCGAQHSMTIIHNRCLFSDKQIIKVQETPDAIPDGQTPHSISLCVYDALVDVARPGDRVEVTGIFRSSPIRLNPRQRKMKSLFRTFIDVVHLSRMGAGGATGLIERGNTALDDLNSLNTSFQEGDQIAAEERIDSEADIREMAVTMGSDLYENLSKSIAPNVFGMSDVKKGLLLQLFGGRAKTLQRNASGSAVSFRGDINVFLAGDPGVSKSQLLQAVHKLAPRGLYTSGKGSSAVGLTAYITRDAESNQLVLESGALVLSDGGVCCIDEFDKMSDETRTILHEVMEQQTVSIAKAGIITTLNARTSILASANPVESKYNPSRSIVENLNLPPTILSRFDIIFLLLDNVNMEDDQRLGRHIVNLYTFIGKTSPRSAMNGTIDSNRLIKYIAYGRSLQPIISEEAAKDLANGYVAMRKVNGGASGAQSKTVSATTRQLESLIRLSEAHARMRLSLVVEPSDVAEAIRVVREAMLSYAIDPLTGKIDMDLINTGKSNALRERQSDLKRSVKAMIVSKGHSSIDMATLLAEMNAQSSVSVNERWIRDVVEELVEEEFFYSSGNIKRGNVTLHRMAQ